MWILLLKNIFSGKTLRLIIAIFFLFLLILLYGFYLRNESLAGQVSSYKSILKHNETHSTFQDKSGRWHDISRPVVIQNTKVLKELAKTDSTLLLLKSQISGLKKDLRNMVSANFINSTNTTTMEANLRDSLAIINDTLKILYQKFDNVTPWLVEHGEIVNGKIRSTRITYDTIIVSAYLKRKWVLGKSYVEAEGVSRNPDTKIFIKSIIVEKKRRKKII